MLGYLERHGMSGITVGVWRGYLEKKQFENVISNIYLGDPQERCESEVVASVIQEEIRSAQLNQR